MSLCLFVFCDIFVQFRSFASNLDQDAKKSFIEKFLSPIIDFIANIFPPQSAGNQIKNLYLQ